MQWCSNVLNSLQLAKARPTMFYILLVYIFLFWKFSCVQVNQRKYHLRYVILYLYTVSFVIGHWYLSKRWEHTEISVCSLLWEVCEISVHSTLYLIKAFSHLIRFVNSHSLDAHRMRIQSTSIAFTLPKCWNRIVTELLFACHTTAANVTNSQMAFSWWLQWSCNKLGWRQ